MIHTLGTLVLTVWGTCTSNLRSWQESEQTQGDVHGAYEVPLPLNAVFLVSDNVRCHITNNPLTGASICYHA
jgi:hypothetical protein